MLIENKYEQINLIGRNFGYNEIFWPSEGSQASGHVLFSFSFSPSFSFSLMFTESFYWQQ